MNRTHYDVVIIGAGIHGAGIAQALAVNGISVLVLEQNEVASGTSSRSSKLIHGGLRYLEHFQFSLVRECLRERKILLNTAPSLVNLSRFMIPVYKNTSRRPWQLRIGLSLYALLGGLRGASRFGTIPKKQWPQLDGLDTKDLKKVFYYYDARTNDAGLTNAVMTSATEHGATLLTSCRFENATIKDNGVQIHYEHENHSHECEAKVLINAAGPWVNHVLAKISGAHEPMPIELVQGAHIIVQGKLTEGMYYVEAPTDGRAVFIMPWQGNTLVGTTETIYSGDPGKVFPLESEKKYLLETLVHYFPHYRDKPVLDSFAGLRVLPHDVAHPFSRPRDTHLIVDNETNPRLLSIYGGKLTAYRLTAARVSRKLKPVLAYNHAQWMDTSQIHITD